MISIGIAVSSITGPLPYAVAAASAASVSPADTPGRDAMPITVSWATPMASGSRPRIPRTDAAFYGGYGPIRHLLSCAR